MRLVLKRSETGYATLSAVPEGSGTPPPVQTGVRVSRALTSRGARELRGACYKAFQSDSPLRAFWTFTVAEQYRELFTVEGADGRPVHTLGAEVRRTLNLIRDSAKRHGWGTLEYVWVAENPGDGNPHVHLLTDLDVPRDEFQPFCAWLESSWGFGFVHLERIRKPDAAGAYLMKAVNYAAKGARVGQGAVYGARYGISSALRVKRESVEVSDADGGMGGYSSLVGSPARPLGHGYWTGRAVIWDDGTNSQKVLADLEQLL